MRKPPQALPDSDGWWWTYAGDAYGWYVEYIIKDGGNLVYDTTDEFGNPCVKKAAIGHWIKLKTPPKP